MDRSRGVLVVDADNFSRIVDIGRDGIVGAGKVDVRIFLALAQEGVSVAIRVGIPAYDVSALIDSLTEGVRGARLDVLLKGISLQRKRLFRSLVEGKVGSVKTDDIATTI